MAEPQWDSFEWDDENRKNGNVQHLRDHGIEPDEAEECFFHDYALAPDDRRFDDVYVLDGRTDLGRTLRLVFQDKQNRLAPHIYRLGIETEEEKKTMKRKFAKLSKPQQEKVEAEYHRMKPEDYDEIMSRATRQTPHAVRLPHRLVEDLKMFAERQGKSEYQTMVKTWIEERLRKEANATR